MNLKDAIRQIQEFRRGLRAPAFSAKSFFVHAVVFALPYLVMHVLGWREYTSIVAGIPPTGSVDDHVAIALGMIYIVSYLVFIFLAPISLLAGAICLCAERVMNRKRSETIEQTEAGPVIALTRARWMLGIVAFGLFVAGVTIWPAVSELKLAVHLVWGEGPASGVLHGFLLKAIEALKTTEANFPFMLYAHDWLAFAHVVLAILFAGAIRDPVRNVWIVQCGLIMCALVPVLGGICIPLRGLPLRWFWIDFAFAPAAALPLYIALRDIRHIGKQASADSGKCVH